MSELFSSVKPGDTVHYLTQQGDARKGKVVMNRGTHLVINRGKGQPQVVNDKNYIKHERGGKVVGALLSRVHHVKEAAKMRVPRVTELPSNVPAIKKTPEQQGLIPSPAAMRAKAEKARIAGNKLSPYKLGEPQMNAAKAFGWVKEDSNVEESVVGAVVGAGLVAAGAAGLYKNAKPKIKAYFKKKEAMKTGEKYAKQYAKDAAMYVANAKDPRRSKRSQSYHAKRAAEFIKRAHSEADKVSKLKTEATWQGAEDPYNWDPVMRQQIFAAAAKKERAKQQQRGQPVPHELDKGRTLKSSPAPFRRGMKEDSHDAEGAAERVAKTKKHKKKLHEVSNTTLTNYVYKAIQDRKKNTIRSKNAWIIHGEDDPERASSEARAAKQKADKRHAGIKKAVAKIASNLPAEPLKAHADSESSKHGGWSGMNEVSAPGQEAWIKANKQRFIAKYGKEKGTKILYAKAWKMAKESVNEEIKRYTTHHDDYMVTSTTGPAGHSISVRHGGTLIAQRLGGKLITNSKSGKKDTKLQDVIKAHTDHPEVQKFLKTNEARESEYGANIQMAASAGKASKPSKPAKGHYLMRDGRKLSGPHSPEDAVKAYKGLSAQGTDTKGVKIVHVKETHMFDVTTQLISEAKVKEAAKKAITLTKAKGNKHVDTEPKLDIQDKGTGGPMGGSHEEPEGSVNAKV